MAFIPAFIKFSLLRVTERWTSVVLRKLKVGLKATKKLHKKLHAMTTKMNQKMIRFWKQRMSRWQTSRKKISVKPFSVTKKMMKILK